jgi:hypothetical protein
MAGQRLGRTFGIMTLATGKRTVRSISPFGE